MLLRRITDSPIKYSRSPFDEFDRLRREMLRLTDAIDMGGFKGPAAGVFPLVNITENNDNYFIRAELPGINTDEIDIEVTHDTLTIAGERKIPNESDEARYHRREREAGKFSRIISLPDDEQLRARAVSGCRFYPRCPERMDGCLAEQPALYSINGSDHQVACYLYEDAQ